MTVESKCVVTAALAGRRIDAADAEAARFPEANVARVKEDIHRTFQQNHVTCLVCAAACGADLLALEVARDLQLERKIVLPFDVGTFRTRSVVDRPGKWGEIYDRIIVEAQTRGELIILNASGEDQTAYEATNQAILDQAISMSEKQIFGPDRARSLKAVIVWDGRSRGDDDVTAAFAQEARRRSFEIYEVITV